MAKTAPVSTMPKPAIFDLNDDELTPSQIIEKYSYVKKAGDSLTPAERSKLASQGLKSMQKITDQQIRFPSLRPKINGIATQEDIDNASFLMAELTAQTTKGAFALPLMNKVTFGMARNNPLTNVKWMRDVVVLTK